MRAHTGFSGVVRLWGLICLITLTAIGPRSTVAQELERPNILVLISEDNSPIAGAYGDELATTPNMDRLASEGFLYTRAYANAPVCAPSRNTLLMGMYAVSGGHQHMRSTYSKPNRFATLPELLRDEGYYTTNNDKEDYNLPAEQTEGIWDESSAEAHYEDRGDGQPFFAVFNNHWSHEYTIHRWKPLSELRHDPDDVVLPPYHPDTPEVRRDWAQYYDSIEHMDGWIGTMLDSLDASGEADNTIVFYFGDHGGVLPRSKRFLYETGTHIPFVIRIPKKFRHLWPAPEPGSKVDRLIRLVDVAPTLLEIVGAPVPDWMQGSAFLGERAAPAPDYVYLFRDRMDEKYDMSRAVRDERFRYIRNYMPYRIYGQHLEYLWQAASMRSWEETCRSGDCTEIQQAHWLPKPAEELYDTQTDPWEVHNLAGDPAYAEVLTRMRGALRSWILEVKDTGFIPEADLIERTGHMPAYVYMRRADVPLERIVDAADTAVTATPEDLPALLSFMDADGAAVRYWGATGLLILGEASREVEAELRQAVDDPSVSVAIVAGEALHRLGSESAGRRALLRGLTSANPMARTHAMNAVESLGLASKVIRQAVISMAKEAGILSRAEYDHRAAKRLMEVWDVDPSDHGIETW